MKIYNVKETRAIYNDNLYQVFWVDFSDEIFLEKATLIFDIEVDGDKKRLGHVFGNGKNDEDTKKFHELKKEDRERIASELFLGVKMYFLYFKEEWPEKTYVIIKPNDVKIERKNE